MTSQSFGCQNSVQRYSRLLEQQILHNIHKRAYINVSPFLHFKSAFVQKRQKKDSYKQYFSLNKVFHEYFVEKVNFDAIV